MIKGTDVCFKREYCDVVLHNVVENMGIYNSETGNYIL